MIKLHVSLLAGLLLAAAPSPARAQDEEEAAPETPAAKTPAAAEAARNKGYQAEEAGSAATGDAPPEAPSAELPAKNAPRSRGVGQGPASFSQRPGSSGGGGSPAGSGLSCEKGVPPVTSVQKSEIVLADANDGNIHKYALGPREALVVGFKTPGSGMGMFLSDSGMVPNMMTISETPCDFDTAKARNAPRLGICSMLAPNSGSVYFTIAGGLSPAELKAAATCLLKPNTHYYMSLRNLMLRDGVPAESCTTSKCTGYWQLRLK